jgi:hypothetical protein
MRPYRVFLIILTIYLVLAFAYSVVMPLAEAPDEADHYAYLRYIGLNRSLPEGPRITQGKHPPLYHGVAAMLTGWTGLDFSFLRSNPDAVPLGPDKPPNLFVHTTLEDFPWRDGALAMHIARLWSVMLGAIALWATWRLGDAVFPDRPAVGLVAAAFLAGLPGFLFISAAINNDNAVAAFGALTLLASAITLRRGPSWQWSLVLGVGLGLGALSKVGALALWPLAGLALLGSWWTEQPRPALRTLLGHLLLVFGLGALLAAPWYVRNWQLYGEPFAWELVLATVDQRLAPLTLADLLWLAWGLHRTFWGRFGGAGQVQLPVWAYGVALVASVALLIGLFRFLFRRYRPPRDTTDLQTQRELLQLLLLGLAPVLVLGTLIRYSAMALGTDQARLLWPALPALAVWVGVGVVGLVDWARKQLAKGDSMADHAKVGKWVGGFVAGMALVGLGVLVVVIRPAFAPPEPVIIDEGIVAVPQLVFDDSLQLLTADLPDQPLALGEPAPVGLVWQVIRPVEKDLRPTLRLVHQDGWLAAEWSHAPAGGRYATDRWQPGQAIADEYLLVPEPASPGRYVVELGVRPFAQDWLPTSEGTGEPFAALGIIEFR